MSRQGNFNEIAAQLSIEDAEMHAVVGQCAQARKEVSAGLELSRDYTSLEHASRTLALCADDRGALELSAELTKRFPEATLTARVAVPVTTAAVAFGRGDIGRVIDVLEPVRRYDHAPSAEFWPAYLRGLAYLHMKNGRAAAAEFQDIIGHRV